MPLRRWPFLIRFSTVLAILSALFAGLFRLGVFARFGMPFFQIVGLPMQIGVIGLGISVFVRIFRRRPDSWIRNVPNVVMLVVPIFTLLGALDIRYGFGGMPTETPSGHAAKSYSVGVESGQCVAVYNRTERILQPRSFCEEYQRHFNTAFAGFWLAFSSPLLWLSWLIVGRDIAPIEVEQSRQRRFDAVFGAINAPSYRWLAIRFAVIVYFAFAGYRGLSHAAIAIPLWAIVIAGGWGAVATRFWIAQSYTRKNRTEPWLKPSWFLNPFQSKQPFQFFHMAAISFITSSAIALFRKMGAGGGFSVDSLPVEAFFGAFGLGTLLGIYWTINVYRARFESAPDPAN